MKLNLGCGNNTKKGFINVDSYQRQNKLDVVCDLIKDFKFPPESAEYIYAEHLLEHFNWKDGRSFLINCYYTLKKDGILRLVIPDYKEVFEAYLNNDDLFFDSFRKALDEDFKYYYRVYHQPRKVLEERPDNPPPSWHTSNDPKDKKKIELRIRHFKHNIEVVQWFTHQFGEHKTLWDYKSLKDFLLRIKFSKVIRSSYQKGFDSDNKNRRKSSLYVEAQK
jgi:hypothetical protein